VAASAGLFVLVPFLADRILGTDPQKKGLRATGSLLLSFLLLAPILWSWVLQTSRRVSPPTYSLVESWLEEEVPREDRLLIERQWLDLHRPRFNLQKVRDLGEALSGGSYQLAYNKWIVVHEWRLGHPALDGLELVRRFKVDSSFGGNTGPDFAVYRSPPIDPLRLPVNIFFDEPDAAAFLGLEWPPDKNEQPGLQLPDGGASLFLPPLETEGVHFEILVLQDQAPTEARSRRGPPPDVPIEVEIEGQLLVLERQVSDVDEVLELAADLPGRAQAPGIIRIMIRPSNGSTTTRVLGVRIR